MNPLYLGYQSAEFDLQNKSEWDTYNEKKNSKRTVCLIENRIKLLQKENNKRLKRTEDTIKKTQNLSRIHEEQDEFGRIKLMHKKEQSYALLEFKQKKDISKIKLEQERSFIRQQIKEMKQLEYGQLKNISQKNEEIIAIEREQKKQDNQQKRQYVRQQAEQSVQKINNYKQNMQQIFTQVHNDTKFKNLAESATHQRQLQGLEELEMKLVGSLQASQQVHISNVFKTLTEANNRLKKGTGGFKTFISQTNYKSFDFKNYSGIRMKTIE